MCRNIADLGKVKGNKITADVARAGKMKTAVNLNECLQCLNTTCYCGLGFYIGPVGKTAQRQKEPEVQLQVCAVFCGSLQQPSVKNHVTQAVHQMHKQPGSIGNLMVT